MYINILNMQTVQALPAEQLRCSIEMSLTADAWAIQQLSSSQLFECKSTTC